MKTYNNKKNYIEYIVIFSITIGIIARFFVMGWGHNYDFESYKIVGEIVSKGRNVYVETERYNYAFLFSVIQGLGFSFVGKHEELFRVYIVGILTLVDVGTMLWIKKKYNYRIGVLYFLNPISIIITGYHNQFDNIAVLFALIASSYFDEESETLTKKDCISITFLTLSMLIKHIIFLFLVWTIFRTKKLGLVKRVIYSLTPAVVFIISFIPFAANNQVAYTGIIEHVFMYRSYNNYPLLRYILELVKVPNQFYFIIYLIIMIAFGIAYRKKTFSDLLLLYFVCIVAFSSAIANQYLIIPIVSLIVSKKIGFFYIYELVGTIYCILNNNELHLSNAISSRVPRLKQFVEAISQEGGKAVTLMTVVLVLFLISVKKSDSNIKSIDSTTIYQEKKWFLGSLHRFISFKQLRIH